MVGDGAKEKGTYASGVARREAILDATVDLLAEVGYHGMALRDVARRVGISHPGVIYHFPNKEALLMAVVERYEKDAGFDLDTIETLEPLAVFDSLLAMWGRISDFPLILEMETMLLVESASDVHPAHEHFSRRNERLEKVLIKSWKILQHEGKTIEDMDPMQVAQTSISLYYGMMITWLYNRQLSLPRIMCDYVLSLLIPEQRALLTTHYFNEGWL